MLLVSLVAVTALVIASRGPEVGAGAPRPAAPAHGSRTGSLNAGGQLRTYRLYLPSSARPERALPLVLVLHGFGGSGAQVERSTGFSVLAEAHDFIAVYPDGLILDPRGGARGWRTEPGTPVDDVEFLTLLLDSVQAAYPVDPARVSVTGHSNGGSMTYRFACDRASRVAAAASVAGPGVGQCAPERAVPLLIIHGTADRTVPYAGGPGLFGIHFRPVQEMVDLWAARNACDPEAELTSPPDQADVVLAVHRACAGGSAVRFYTIVGGSHRWPGDTLPRGVGEAASLSLDATRVIWEFFRSHGEH